MQETNNGIYTDTDTDTKVGQEDNKLAQKLCNRTRGEGDINDVVGIHSSRM